MIKLALATLLFWQVTEAAFLPDSILIRTGKWASVSPIELLPVDAQVSSRKLITLAARDPFLNTPMPGSSKRRKDIYDRDEFISSRFERFDKKKYGDELLDSRLDDFINRKKPAGGRPDESYEESKFQRYDRDKDGDLLLKNRRNNDKPIIETMRSDGVAKNVQRSAGKYQTRKQTEPRSRGKDKLHEIPKATVQARGVKKIDHKLKNLNENPRSGASNFEDSFQLYDHTEHGGDLGGTKTEEIHSDAKSEDEELGESDKKDESKTRTREIQVKSTKARTRRPVATRPTSRGSSKGSAEEFSKPSREKVKTRVIPIPRTATPKFDMKSTKPEVERRSGPPPPKKSGSFKLPLEARIYKSRPPQRNFRLQPNPLQNATIPKIQRRQRADREQQPPPSTVLFPSINARTAPSTPSSARGEGSTLGEYEVNYEESTDLMEKMYESALMDAVGLLTEGHQASPSSEDIMQDAFDSNRRELETLYETALMDAVGHRAQADKPYLAKGEQPLASSEESMQDAFESNMMELIAQATENSEISPPPAGGWDDFIPPPQRSHDYLAPMPRGCESATSGDDEETIFELQRQIEELREMVRMTPTSKEGGHMRGSERQEDDDDNDDDKSFANAVAYETLSPKLTYDLLEEERRWDVGSSDTQGDDMADEGFASATAYIHEAEGYDDGSSREAASFEEEWLSHPSMDSYASELEEQADAESGWRKVKAPGFVGFSGIDWSNGRMG